MKKFIEFNSYLNYLFDEALSADMDFKLKQAWFRVQVREGKIPEPGEFSVLIEDVRKQVNPDEIQPDQLCVEEIKFDFNLKPYKPGFFRSIILWIKKKKVENIYQLSIPDVNTIPVSVTLRRADAFSNLEPDYDKQVTADKILAV